MNMDLHPDEFRELAIQVVDAICRQLGDARAMKARPFMSDSDRSHLLTHSLPRNGADPEALLQKVFKDVFPFHLGNGSPRFFGWVNSTGAPLGVIADFIASAMNPSCSGAGGHAATYVEHCVLSWIKEMLGFSQDADAVLTSGGSMANLLCLGAMRQSKSAGEVRRQGMSQQSRPQVIYVTDQSHSCISRAADVLGFGTQNMRIIPHDSDYRMCTTSLHAQLLKDSQNGLQPVCVAASAGTVNTGVIDPLSEIADVCAEHDLWFHIDASYGGFAILLPELSECFAGFTRADSVAVDPHKWLCVPVDCGCAVVAHTGGLRSAFGVKPSYLGEEDELPWLAESSIEWTRPFRALKLWLQLQHMGVSGYESLIRRNIELNQLLQNQIRARPEFRLCASGPLSISCFVYDPGMLDDVEQTNRRILEMVQRQGKVFLTSTRLDGEFVLRSCIVNFRTMESDVEALLDEIIRVARSC